MRHLLCLLLVALPISTSAKDATISMMYSNATEGALPFELVRSGSWSAAPAARFVKLHLYLDEPIDISAVEIDGCSEPPANNYSLWLNFDEWSSGSKSEEGYPYPEEFGVSGKTFYARAFQIGTKARSLTWNFERWRGVSLCGLRVYDESGKPYALHVPAVVAGTGRASSTLPPLAAYDIMNLFDSRFEYAWASEHKETGVDLVFRFDEPQTVDRLRIWNGYQRSPAHCSANSRARRLRISGDGGYSATIEVADALGSQSIPLPRPFSGRELHISVAEAYPGRAYQDLVISELRFGNGPKWFTLDSLPMIRSASNANRARFEAAGFPRVLNESFVDEEDAESAVLRLRADGSFYLSGVGAPQGHAASAKPSHEDPEEVVRYFTLGNFEMLEQDPQKGLRLRLFGLYYETAAYGDCNGCGRDCNRKEDESRGRIFQEHVWMKPGAPRSDGAAFTLLNESRGRTLPFRTISFRVEVPN